MLNDERARVAWEKGLEAQVRSLYFAELASSYTKRKQIIAGISFFLSSAAAASLAAKLPYWVALIMATIVAVVTGYSIAVGLDLAAVKMAKLHAAWNSIAHDFERLWHHRDSHQANEDELEDLLSRARETSEMGATEAPYKQALLDKWEKFVYSQTKPLSA